MNFKFLKNQISNITKDSITSSLGLGTKKERMDEDLKKYRRNDFENAKYQIAERNIIISELKNRIAYYESLLKPLEEYIKLYEQIEDLSENEITKQDSDIEILLNKPEGSKFASGNYSVLSEIVRFKQNADIVSFLVKQLENQKEMLILSLIDNFIIGLGKININGKEIENTDIYYNFKKLQQLVELKALHKINGDIYNFKIETFSDAKLLKDNILIDKNEISLLINKLNLQLNKLNNETSDNERTIQIIEETKELILTSPEYVSAKLSHEYLEELNKLKK